MVSASYSNSQGCENHQTLQLLRFSKFYETWLKVTLYYTYQNKIWTRCTIANSKMAAEFLENNRKIINILLIFIRISIVTHLHILIHGQVVQINLY